MVSDNFTSSISGWFRQIACLILQVLLLAGTVSAEYVAEDNFWEKGRITSSYDDLGDRGYGIAVQPDGKIIVAGARSSSSDYDFVLARFLPDGSPDMGFDFDGRLTTHVGRYDDEAFTVDMFADGRIVAAGYSENETDRDFALACYFPDGSPDLSFGDGGVVVNRIGNGHEEIIAVTVDHEDRLLAAGVIEGTRGRVIGVARYFNDGSPDQDFGEGGIRFIGLGDEAVAQGILQQPNGRIIVSGTYAQGEGLSSVLIALHPDGSMDSSFGHDGIAGAPESIAVSEGYGTAADSEGRIYLATAVERNGQLDGVLLRFTPDGQPDFSFHQLGYVTLVAGPEDDVLYDLKLTASGDVVAAGYTTQNGVRRFLVATYSVSSPDDTDGTESQEGDKQPIGISQLKVLAMQHPSGVRPAMRPGLDPVLAEGDDTGTWSLVRNAFQKAYVYIADFLVSPVAASELTVEDSQGRITLQVGKENAEGYAMALTQEGDVVVVGATTDDTGDSMVIAGFAAAGKNAAGPVVGVVDQAIVTGRVTDITRTGAEVAVEISSDLSEVTRSGVVFSTSPGPVLRESSVAGGAEEGSTEEGGKNGSFLSAVGNLNPGTLYYVRAYAIAGGILRYGNEISFRTADSCFIATAAFGTILHPYVRTLRQFRDQYMLKSAIGTEMVYTYYEVSPPIAEYIAGNPLLRGVVRCLLLPVIGLAWLMVELGPFVALLSLGTFFATAYRVFQLRKPAGLR